MTAFLIKTLDVAVVAADGVEHGCGFLAVFADELHADGGMAAFHSGGVIHRLADVVEEAAAAGEGSR